MRLLRVDHRDSKFLEAKRSRTCCRGLEEPEGGAQEQQEAEEEGEEEGVHDEKKINTQGGEISEGDQLIRK